MVSQVSMIYEHEFSLPFGKNLKKNGIFGQIAILLDCVKEEMYKENPQKKVSKENEIGNTESNMLQHSSPFWTVRVLDFVEFVLKPPNGGPPVLPEFTDAVTFLFLSLFWYHVLFLLIFFVSS